MVQNQNLVKLQNYYFIDYSLVFYEITKDNFFNLKLNQFA